MAIKNRQEWIFSNSKILDNKDSLVRNQFQYLFNKTLRMFKYSNLPKTIPEKDLEIILQLQGYVTFAKDDKGDLYCFASGLGGVPNPYYLPTISIVANPALRLNKEYTIDKDCVVMLNDDLYQGLSPLISRYASLLVECELSLKQAILNARIPAVVQADNDNTKQSAEDFFKQIERGEGYGIITSKQFFDGLKAFSFNTNTTNIKDIIESLQYIKGSFYNEIGLSSQFNMKREAINEAEAVLNEDVLYPLIDTMLKCRQDGLDKVNAMFGTNITVDFDSVWKQNELEEKMQFKILEAESKEDEEDEVDRDTNNTTNDQPS